MGGRALIETNAGSAGLWSGGGGDGSALARYQLFFSVLLARAATLSRVSRGRRATANHSSAGDTGSSSVQRVGDRTDEGRRAVTAWPKSNAGVTTGWGRLRVHIGTCAGFLESLCCFTEKACRYIIFKR
ncbi:hypothetical protein MRX96_054227 [Rhipicephalus microplus]